MKRVVLTILLLATTLSLNAFAVEVPPQPLGRVSDYTGTLTSAETRTIEERLAKFEEETTNQIAVVLISTLSGDKLEDYSTRLAEKWKIGQKGKDNGVILLIVKEDRKIRIEVGYGLEGVLPDAKAGDIIRDDMAPRFRNGKFFAGIQDAVDSIILAVEGVSAPSSTVTPPRKTRKTERYSSLPEPHILALWLVLTAVAVGLLFLLLEVIKKMDGGEAGYYSPGSGGGGFSGGFSGGGGGFGGGGASGGW
jgi:uncharacterized protein